MEANRKIIVVGVIGGGTIPTRLIQEAKEMYGTEVELITVEQAQQRMIPVNECLTIASVTITRLPDLLEKATSIDEDFRKVRKQERQDWKHRQKYHNKKW